MNDLSAQWLKRHLDEEALSWLSLISGLFPNAPRAPAKQSLTSATGAKVFIKIFPGIVLSPLHTFYPPNHSKVRHPRFKFQM